MFIIIGGDGKEYGPVTADQIRAWIASGRANLDTQAKALGTDEWRRVGDFAEFSSPDGAPPVMSASSSAAAEGGAATASDPQLASRGRRLAARLLDWIFGLLCKLPGILMIGSYFLQPNVLQTIVNTATSGRRLTPEDLDLPRLIPGLIVIGCGWLVGLVTEILLMSFRSQSVGKLIMGIRVVRVTDGSPAGFVHAWLLRECVMTVIGAVISVLPVLGPILLYPGFSITDWCLIFRGDHRCLHDLIAGTKVVKA